MEEGSDNRLTSGLRAIYQQERSHQQDRAERAIAGAAHAHPALSTPVETDFHAACDLQRREASPVSGKPREGGKWEVSHGCMRAEKVDRGRLGSAQAMETADASKSAHGAFQTMEHKAAPTLRERHCHPPEPFRPG